eukprot:1738655-Pleurochrysis_carterae.AAC.1
MEAEKVKRLDNDQLIFSNTNSASGINTMNADHERSGLDLLAATVYQPCHTDVSSFDVSSSPGVS